MEEIPHVNSPEEPDDVKKTAETIDAVNASNAKRKASGGGHRQGPFCLMCCGCFHLLRNDGTTAFFNPTRGDREARCFSTIKNMNTIARSLGWMATDDGDNHRCPKCYERYKALRAHELEHERVGCALPAAHCQQRWWR